MPKGEICYQNWKDFKGLSWAEWIRTAGAPRKDGDDQVCVCCSDKDVSTAAYADMSFRNRRSMTEQWRRHHRLHAWVEPPQKLNKYTPIPQNIFRDNLEMAQIKNLSRKSSSHCKDSSHSCHCGFLCVCVCKHHVSKHIFQVSGFA